MRWNCAWNAKSTSTTSRAARSSCSSSRKALADTASAVLRLWRQAMDYFADCQVARFYLHTDSVGA